MLLPRRRKSSIQLPSSTPSPSLPPWAAPSDPPNLSPSRNQKPNTSCSVPNISSNSTSCSSSLYKTQSRSSDWTTSQCSWMIPIHRSFQHPERSPLKASVTVKPRTASLFWNATPMQLSSQTPSRANFVSPWFRSTLPPEKRRVTHSRRNTRWRTWRSPHPTSWPRSPFRTSARAGRRWAMPMKCWRSSRFSSDDWRMPWPPLLTISVCSHAMAQGLSNLTRLANLTCCT
mmetsp:Transcript_404/g.1120  ORF Transcript_404/g.1120 Transcript_404/m.1120 type:complete len:230 (+) Transcript_404:65-754(+)